MNYEIQIDRSELATTLKMLAEECGSSTYDDLEELVDRILIGCKSSFSAFHLTLKFSTINDLTESAIILRKYQIFEIT